jgi:hypothetical protein
VGEAVGKRRRQDIPEALYLQGFLVGHLIEAIINDKVNLVEFYFLKGMYDDYCCPAWSYGIKQARIDKWAHR